jgi:hypothetical protein
VVRPVCRGTLHGDCWRGAIREGVSGHRFICTQNRRRRFTPSGPPACLSSREAEGEYAGSPREPEEHTLECSGRNHPRLQLVLLSLEENRRSEQRTEFE